MNSQSILVKRARLNKRFKTMLNFGNAFSHRIRVMIMKILNDNNRCVCELEAILDESQSTISHHLRILEYAGLITSKKIGHFTYYESVKEQLDKYLSVLNEIFKD